MIELFIEGQPVDISDNFSTLISYAIDDIREFGTKNSNVSKTIILPGTKRNNKLFGNFLMYRVQIVTIHPFLTAT